MLEAELNWCILSTATGVRKQWSPRSTANIYYQTVKFTYLHWGYTYYNIIYNMYNYHVTSQLANTWVKTSDPSFVHDTCAGAVVLHFVRALPIAPTSQPCSATLLFLGKEWPIFSMSLESSCREKKFVLSAKRFSSTSYTSKWKVGRQPTALANQWRNQIRNWHVRCFCQIMWNLVRCVNGKHAHILSTEKTAGVESKKQIPIWAAKASILSPEARGNKQPQGTSAQYRCFRAT